MLHIMTDTLQSTGMSEYQPLARLTLWNAIDRFTEALELSCGGGIPSLRPGGLSQALASPPTAAAPLSASWEVWRTIRNTMVSLRVRLPRSQRCTPQAALRWGLQLCFSLSLGPTSFLSWIHKDYKVTVFRG